MFSLAYLGKLHRHRVPSCSIDRYMEFLQIVLSGARFFHIFSPLYHTLQSTFHFPTHPIDILLKHQCRLNFKIFKDIVSSSYRIGVTAYIYKTVEPLPGQTLSLHISFFDGSPSHFPPLPSFTFLLLVNEIVPSPQLVEHCSPFSQSVHLQSTGEAEIIIFLDYFHYVKLFIP